MTPFLQVADYHKSYDHESRPVLDIKNLALQQGVYWLKGANGSGKTTLLKSLAGLMPFDGNILVKGINSRKQRMLYRKTVNWSAAEPVYPDFLSGNDLVAFYQSTKGGMQSVAKNLASRLGVEKFLHQKTGAYSSGMTKKLSLMLAFMGEPELILLDEPLITLDTETMPVIGQLIKEYHEAGVSFIISSHHELSGFTPSILTIRDQTIVYHD